MREAHRKSLRSCQPKVRKFVDSLLVDSSRIYEFTDYECTKRVDLAGLVLRYADGGMNTYLTEWAATPIRVVPRESRLSSLGDESFLFRELEAQSSKWRVTRAKAASTSDCGLR